ncbi:hypothetical protein EC988_002882 [Linderina pennispora]|nr:hypothetical protein EC988_002882 [Linderina pennispora]
MNSASLWRGSVILSIDNMPTPDIRAFAAAFARLRQGTRVAVRFFALDQPYKQKVMIMNVSTHWHAMRLARRDTAGHWQYTELPAPLQPSDVEPQTASLAALPGTLAPADSVWPSIVHLDFHIPYLVDGMKSTQYVGPGFIVDKKLGLIVCDRDTVPIGVGDVHITIANSIVLTGKVAFLHPVYNFAVVQYDPAQIGDTPVRDLEFHPEYYSGQRHLVQGDSVFLVGISSEHTPVVRKTEISARSMVSTRECLPPRFRCMNVEGVKLNDQPSSQGGVLCDGSGRALGLWTNVSSQDSSHKDTSSMTGLDVSLLKPTLDAMRNGQLPDIRSLDVELWTVRLAAARTLGLSAERIRSVEQTQSDSPRLLYVLGLLASESPAARLLRTGDVLLEMNGKPVRNVADIAVIHDAESVDLVVLRDGREAELHVPTTRLDGMETQRVVHWAGALVQTPYRAVQEQIRRLPSNVYVSCTLYGSPANCYGLKPGMWITEIENTPVDDIDAFIRIIKDLSLDCAAANGRYVRVTVVNRNEITRVLSLRVDNHYWPPWQLLRDPTAASNWRAEFAI